MFLSPSRPVRWHGEGEEGFPTSGNPPLWPPTTVQDVNLLRSSPFHIYMSLFQPGFIRKLFGESQSPALEAVIIIIIIPGWVQTAVFLVLFFFFCSFLSQKTSLPGDGESWMGKLFQNVSGWCLPFVLGCSRRAPGAPSSFWAPNVDTYNQVMGCGSRGR